MAKTMSRLAANAPDRMPMRSGRNEPSDRGRKQPEADAGSVNAGRSGHGRVRRPEIFTMRRGEPEIEQSW